MDKNISRSDWLFLCICLLLGILAEELLLRDQIGISYFLFISAFYAVFFWRYRKFSFSHQRFGYLVIICIWLLAASYFLNDNMVFYALNFMIVPVLVIFHLVLVTSPKHLKWSQPVFIPYLFSRLLEVVKYNVVFGAHLGNGWKQGVNENKFLIWKKVFIGVLLSIPVLLVVLKLLMSADTQFERIIGGIPQWFMVVDAETIVRAIVILVCTFAFFGFMQVLINKQMKVIEKQTNNHWSQFDAIIAITILVLINAVYVLFTLVQFKYFFSGTLQGDFTYAQYARKGFFELLFVSLINLSITILVITFVNLASNGIKRVTQVLLTFLILSSAVILSSAFLRLGMYEDAFGFTFTRVLAHSFMIFLTVIFMYTLVKIWVEKLSLFHFYFICSLLYYTAISVVDLDRIVLKENMVRYETTGKIDVQYLNSMSSTGVIGLIDLYKKEPNIPDLTTILQSRKNEAAISKKSWKSYNLKREQAFMELNQLQLK